MMPTLAQKYENDKQDINALTAADVTLGNGIMTAYAGPLASTAAATLAKRAALSKLISVFAPAQGRLTLESGVPYSTTNQLAKTRIYWTPFRGNNIALYDGTRWNLRQFTETYFDVTNAGSCTTVNGSPIIEANYMSPPAEPFHVGKLIVGMKVTGTGIPASSVITTINGDGTFTINNNATADGTVTLTFKVPAGTVYDVCGIDGAIGIEGSGQGELALTLVKWTNATTRANALAMQDGVYCLTDAIGTNAGSRYRYLGTICTTGTDGETADSFSWRYVFNQYNRLRRIGFCYNTTNSWTYGTGAWREANGGTGQVRFNCIIGQPTEIRCVYGAWFSTPAGGGYCGACIDSTTTASWDMLSYGSYLAAGYYNNTVRKILTPGYHYATQVEWCNATGTYYGYGTETSNAYQGMFVVEM